MRRRLTFPALALGLFMLASTLGGGAAAAVTWTQVSTGDVINFAEPGLHRTADGVLHVMWPEDNALGDADILHATIAPDGTVTAPTLAQENWWTLWPGGGDIVPAADGGIAYFFGGLRSNAPGEPNDGLNMIASDAAGTTWDVHLGNLEPPATVARSSTIGAAVDATLTPYQIWGSSVHRGLDPASPATSFQGAAGFGCCSYNGGLAADALTGAMYAGWYSNAAAPNRGVWVQEVSTTDGTPVGSPTRMPGSVSIYNGTEQSADAGTRIPMTGRPGAGGVFVAWPGGYPSQHQLLLWQPFDAEATTVWSARETDIDDPAIAASPDGRLWVAWTQGERVFARRSNLDVTRWGAAVKVPWPPEQESNFDLKIDSGDGFLDVIGNFDSFTSSPAFFHVRLLPGLKVAAQPGSFRREARVRFTVTDAGDPVAGATVKVDGKTKTTNASGVAQIRLGPYNRARRLTAKATAPGYKVGKTTVRVRR